MKYFTWRNTPQWIATAHAESVAQARNLLLGEVGGIDGSCVVRAKARQVISEEAPEIWTGPNAEFALTDSAELEEQDAELTRLRAQLAAETTRRQGLERRVEELLPQVAAEREAREEIEREKRRIAHLLGEEREARENAERQRDEMAAALDLLMNPNAEELNHYYREPRWRQHDGVCGTHTMARAYLRIGDIVMLLDAKKDATAILAARDKGKLAKGAAWALRAKNECWCPCCREAVAAAIESGEVEVGE